MQHYPFICFYPIRKRQASERIHQTSGRPKKFVNQQSSPGGGEESRLQKAERRIGELEAFLKKKDEEIARQAEQIGLLSKLSVSIDGKSISVPEYLQINQAIIKTATVQQAQFSTKEPAVIEAVSPGHIAAVSASFAPLNKSKLTSIRSRIAKLPKMERDILRVVHQQEKSLNVYEIAAWLNVAGTSVRKNPPLTLIAMGLLSRRSTTRGYSYSSNVKEFLKREFPGTDQGEVLQQLFEVLSDN